MDRKQSYWEVQDVAHRIERRLKAAGVRVTRKEASTGSIYMTLDEGLAYHIRISDHDGPLHHRYRYNMLTCPYTHKRRHNGDVVRFYYNPSEFYRMISAILSMRKSKIMSIGAKEYRTILNQRNSINQLKRRSE